MNKYTSIKNFLNDKLGYITMYNTSALSLHTAKTRFIKSKIKLSKQ